MSFDRASLEVFIARLRWAAVGLGLLEAVISRPPPVSVPLALGATALMAGYNLPASLARRLPEGWTEPMVALALVGDFLVTCVWLFQGANDRYDPTFSLFCLVAIEAAVLYGWRGVWPFVTGFLAAYSAEVWVRATVFHLGFQPDTYVLEAALTSLVACFTGFITAESERRRRAAGRAAAEAEREAQLAEALHVVAGRITRALKRDTVMDVVVTSLRDVFPLRWHAVLLAEGPEREFAYLADGEPAQQFITPNGPSFGGVEAPVVVGDLRTDERMRRHLSGPTDLLLVYRSAALLPLWAGGRLLGLLVTLDPEVDAFPPDEVSFLESLAYQISTALENARLYEGVERLSLTDATTGLFNRRAFDRRLEEELVRAARYHLPTALMMLDVDFFKAYNDTYGHLAGDGVLRELARVLEGGALRHVDLPFRFGGEEFAVILPHTEPEEALKLARRLCHEVSVRPFLNAERQPGGKLTISIGVAAYPAHALAGAELVEAADRALYMAKRGGRNRASLAPGRRSAAAGPSARSASG